MRKRCGIFQVSKPAEAKALKGMCMYMMHLPPPRGSCGPAAYPYRVCPAQFTSAHIVIFYLRSAPLRAFLSFVQFVFAAPRKATAPTRWASRAQRKPELAALISSLQARVSSSVSLTR